jgi:predicted HicB family RNase H-like nuclease
MAAMMTYEGYVGSVTFDDDAGILFGTVTNIEDVITFHGTSVEEIRQAFHDSVDFYALIGAKREDAPEEPRPRQAAS